MLKYGRVDSIERKWCGSFCLEPIATWIAYDAWNHEVGRGRTKRECVQDARDHGYSVPHDLY